MNFRHLIRWLAALAVGYVFLFGCSTTRTIQVTEERTRLPEMEQMPNDSSKVDTTYLPSNQPKDPDTVLPPP